jgi:hypothetical protein
VDTWEFHTNETGLEEEFSSSESLVLDGDNVSVREFIWLVVGS